MRVSQIPRTHSLEKHIEYWKRLCDNLDHVEKDFNSGKTRKEVLARFKKPRNSQLIETLASET